MSYIYLFYVKEICEKRQQQFDLRSVQEKCIKNSKESTFVCYIYAICGRREKCQQYFPDKYYILYLFCLGISKPKKGKNYEPGNNIK